MRETASRLLLDASSIDNERGVIKSEERQRQSPQQKFLDDYFETTFPELRISKRIPIGDMKIVETAPRDEFVKLYQGLYRPERTFITIVGDIDAKDAENLINKHFADWKNISSPIKDPDMGKISPPLKQVKNYVDSQLSTDFTLTQLAPYKAEADTSIKRRNDLLIMIANSIINERFAKIARNADAPIFTASFGIDNFYKSAKLTNLSISVKDQSKWRDALEVGDGEIRKALTYGFTAEEFNSTLANIYQNFQKSVKESDARRSRDIADGILSSFENDQVYTSSTDGLKWFETIAPSLNANEALNALKMSIGQNFDPNIYLISPKPIEGGETAISNAYQKIKKIAPKPPKKQKIKAWDYNLFGPVSYSHSRADDAQINVSYVKFENNVNLVVKQTDFEKGRVRVAVRFGEGQLSLPKDKVGLDLAIDTSYISGGLGRLNIDEFQKTLAGKNVSIDFRTHEDSFEMSSVTDNDNLQLQMQIFAAYFTDPAWRSDGFNQLKAARDLLYKDENATPMSVLMRKIWPILSTSKTRKQFPTVEDFNKLTLEDAKKYLDEARKNSAVEIIVVGDTNVENAIKSVSTTFGALPKRQALPNPRIEERKESFPQGRNITLLSHEGSKNQAALAIFWKGNEYGNGIKAKKATLVKDMLQIKLTDIIREREGGTYSPYTINDASTAFTNFGTIGAILDVKPQDIDKYIAMTEEIAKDLANGKIDQDLFNRAKMPEIASLDVETKNNPWWLFWLGNSPWDKNRQIIIRDGKKQYEEITIDDLKAVAKEVFNPNQVQIIKVLPK